jgi:hypothetical protein
LDYPVGIAGMGNYVGSLRRGGKRTLAKTLRFVRVERESGSPAVPYA